MRTTFEEFKKKALADPEVKKEYRKLSPAYALRKQLIKIRKDAGLTQAEILLVPKLCLGILNREASASEKEVPKLELGNQVKR